MVKQPFAVQGPVGEHPKKGQSIYIHCSPMYLLLNIWQKFPLFKILTSIVQGGYCHNPNLGFATKARACKGVGPERSLIITFHAPESVGECEKMNPHTPK